MLIPPMEKKSYVFFVVDTFQLITKFAVSMLPIKFVLYCIALYIMNNLYFLSSVMLNFVAAELPLSLV